MLEVFQSVMTPMLRMVFFIVAGFILRRAKVLPDNSATVLSKLESWCIIPLMILNSLTRYCTVASIRSNYRIMLDSLVIQLVCIALAIIFCGKFSEDEYEKKVYRYSMIYCSYGFMGNALVNSMFGPEVLYYYLMFTIVMNIGCYTYGVAMLIPSEKGKMSSLLKRLCQPTVITMAIGAFIGISGLNRFIPAFFSEAMSNGATMMGPIAMILTGFTIAGFDLKPLVTNRRVYILCLVRMIVYPIVIVAVMILLKANRLALILAFFCHASPSGLYTIIYPSAYGESPVLGSSLAIVSHLLSIFSIPTLFVILSFVMEKLAIV